MKTITLTVLMLVFGIAVRPIFAQNTNLTEASEFTAWEFATKTGTPSAYLNYYKTYPNSQNIITKKGTVRGRCWFKINSNELPDGVIVTVDSTDLLINVSLEEAKTLRAISFRPVPKGTEDTARIKTFNYGYCEIIEGGLIIGKREDNTIIYELIEPRDNLNCTVILSADGKRLLTWDVSNIKAADQPNPEPTFIESAALEQPFKDLPSGFDIQYTPKSQEAMLTTKSPGELIKTNPINTNPINIVKPGSEFVNLDTNVTERLEAFHDKDDAIIYIYRLSSFVGCAVKWKVQVDNNEEAKLGQKQYLVKHLSTSELSHLITHSGQTIAYTNFLPNRYYFFRLKGFSLKTGLLSADNYEEIKKCNNRTPKSWSVVYHLQPFNIPRIIDPNPPLGKDLFT